AARTALRNEATSTLKSAEPVVTGPLVPRPVVSIPTDSALRTPHSTFESFGAPSPIFHLQSTEANLLKGLKVCFIAGTLGQGGAERQLFYILKCLKEHGANVT